MKRVILKTHLEIVDEQEIFLLGDNPEIIALNMQGENPALWYETTARLPITTTAPKQSVKLRILGTGQPWEKTEEDTYLGTLLTPYGFVWHVYSCGPVLVKRGLGA